MFELLWSVINSFLRRTIINVESCLFSFILLISHSINAHISTCLLTYIYKSYRFNYSISQVSSNLCFSNLKSVLHANRVQQITALIDICVICHFSHLKNYNTVSLANRRVVADICILFILVDGVLNISSLELLITILIHIIPEIVLSSFYLL